MNDEDEEWASDVVGKFVESAGPFEAVDTANVRRRARNRGVLRRAASLGMIAAVAMVSVQIVGGSENAPDVATQPGQAEADNVDQEPSVTVTSSTLPNPANLIDDQPLQAFDTRVLSDPAIEAVNLASFEFFPGSRVEFARTFPALPGQSPACSPTELTYTASAEPTAGRWTVRLIIGNRGEQCETSTLVFNIDDSEGNARVIGTAQPAVFASGSWLDLNLGVVAFNGCDPWNSDSIEVRAGGVTVARIDALMNIIGTESLECGNAPTPATEVEGSFEPLIGKSTGQESTEWVLEEGAIHVGSPFFSEDVGEWRYRIALVNTTASQRAVETERCPVFSQVTTSGTAYYALGCRDSDLFINSGAMELFEVSLGEFSGVEPPSVEWTLIEPAGDA